MPPKVHTCLECHTQLPKSADKVECRGCGKVYKIEDADRGARVYPVDGDKSLTMVKLERIVEFAEEREARA